MTRQRHDGTRIFNGDFSTGIDWDTGINLPVLFRGSWKVQPAVGIANTTSATALACALAYERGARLFRVHDVAAAREALSLARAVGGMP